jgi:pheromone alpha factor receptor
MGVQVLTIVCIFLPLSAIWAGVINETIPASSGPDSHHKLIQGEFYRVSQKSGACSDRSTNNTSEKSRQLSVCTCASKGNTTDSAATTPSLRRSGRGVYGEDSILIDREFGFTKEAAADERV